MKRMIALVLSLVMVMGLCVSPAWGAEDATEQAAQEFVAKYLSNDKGDIYGHIKGFDGSRGKMFESEAAWGKLSDEAQARVNELLDAAYDDLSYKKLQEWTQGFEFMLKYLVIAEGDYEGYIISTDPNGGTLVDPDPPYTKYAVHPFTYNVWQRIAGAEDDYVALSADAKDYLNKLMTEPSFALNNGIEPNTLAVASFTDLLSAAKEKLAADEDELAAQEFVDTYLRSTAGKIYGHVKGFDGSRGKMFESEAAWGKLSDEAKECVNAILNEAQTGLSYEKLQEWTQGFEFMLKYLMIYEEGGEEAFEGYIFSTDPNGGTLVDPDPPHDTFFVMPFTHDIWVRIVGAETAWKALPDNAKAYLDRLLTEKDFGLNSGLNPSTLQAASFATLLSKAKENLSAYKGIEDKLAGANSAIVGGLTTEMVNAIANGGTVEFKVLDGDEQKIDADSGTKDAFEQAMKDFDLKGHTISSYLKIEIQMSVDNGTPLSITRTADKIEICLGKAEPGREYTVLRNHEGKIDLLDAYERNGLIYTESSYFSTYALLEKAKTPSGYYGGYVTPAEETPSEVTSADTFDAGVGSAIAVTILSMTGLAWLGKKKD